MLKKFQHDSDIALLEDFFLLYVTYFCGTIPQPLGPKFCHSCASRRVDNSLELIYDIYKIYIAVGGTL
jgi:hypothetical protein